MVSLFESKLNSLPNDIVNKYPQLKNIEIGNFTSDRFIVPTTDTNIINTDSNNFNNNSTIQHTFDKSPLIHKKLSEPIIEVNEVAESVEEKELSPQEKLQKIVDQNPQLEVLVKSLKIGIPMNAVLQKAKMQAIDSTLAEELISIYKLVNPNIS